MRRAGACGGRVRWGRVRWGTGGSGRPDSDPGGNSLRLLPSGPDRVGEAPVRRRSPGPAYHGWGGGGQGGDGGSVQMSPGDPASAARRRHDCWDGLRRFVDLLAVWCRPTIRYAPVADHREAALMIPAVLASLILCLLAVVHLYWAAGGAIGKDAAVPSLNGERVLSPGAFATAMVGVGLFGVAMFVIVTAVGFPARIFEMPLRIGTGLIGLVFAAWAIGDFRYVDSANESGTPSSRAVTPTPIPPLPPAGGTDRRSRHRLSARDSPRFPFLRFQASYKCRNICYRHDLPILGCRLPNIDRGIAVLY
jgi:Protein of unknown function (DUF3995)